ncbi:MAG: hypothetical protein IT423_14100 [Pirellulaceae bacterium]|nr:hypothetical protein [Pirellulaceae bacterium]
MLPREEYVEQAHFFRTLVERVGQNLPLQELLEQSRYEILATTKLPMAIDLMLAELKHRGQMSSGMAVLRHYFTPFQTFLVAEAETDRGRFDYRTALRILAAEADYRSREINLQGLFFFEFEAMSRNRLNYDRGLKAMAEDSTFPGDWKVWLLNVRRQLGLIDLADLIYARSELFHLRASQIEDDRVLDPVLFGMQEGKIAQANRRKDTLFLFAAMQRHLSYPGVPKQEPVDTLPALIPQIQRRLERLESRIKLLEDEQRGGIDITKFYTGKGPEPPDDILG